MIHFTRRRAEQLNGWSAVDTCLMVVVGMWMVFLVGLVLEVW